MGHNQDVAPTVTLPDEEATRRLGADLARLLKPGDTVLLSGPLGAGKSCLVRGLLQAWGHPGPVPSPTFNLMVVYELGQRVVHADFYRLASAVGTGIEDELGEAVCLIEWPDRMQGLVDPTECWQVDLAIEGDHRVARVTLPHASTTHT